MRRISKLTSCYRRCKKQLSCGHQCPTICCDPCPSPDFCQQCATSEVKSLRVDLITFESYEDINLDESPVLIFPCGHVLTLESADGQMDMAQYYEIDGDGWPIALKDSSQPFSMKEVKSCPDCRAPLRSIRRYGRLVRRALLDESTKKFIVWSNANYVDLARRLQVLEDTPEVAATLIPPSNAFDIRLDGPRDHQISIMNKRHIMRQLLGPALALRSDMSKHQYKVRKDEQPFRRVFDLVRTQNRQGNADANFTYDEGVVQTRSGVLAMSLVLRCDLFILSRLIEASKRAKGFSRQRKVEVFLEQNRGDCDRLIALAQEATQPRQEFEGNILCARFAALERSVGKSRLIMTHTLTDFF